MRIMIVAGEASGDILGAGLMKSLQALRTDIEFFGIGGPLMQSLGFNSLYPMERLSVMGIVEPLKRLPELLHIRKSLKQQALQQKIDLFIGIDSPDFNLNIEYFLKFQGIKTAHYVSPSVWAWRQGRIKKIKKSVDLMLTLLPFEAEFYQQHNVPVRFVGHTLADDLPMNPDVESARKKLHISPAHFVIALLPGSRAGEVALLGRLFLQVAVHLQQKLGACHFVLPAANEHRKLQIQAQLAEFPQLSVQLLDGQSHLAMEAADAVLLASGTTALEAMLLKKPMVVAYKLAPLSAFIIARLIKTPFVALPNLLAKKMLVKELLQGEATVDNLAAAMLDILSNESVKQSQVAEFYQLHESIRKNASDTAAQAIMELLC
jgi:lipid-A-disaccharide synthase